MQGNVTDLLRYRKTSEKRNFIERIEAPIFLEIDLAVETMSKPQSSLEGKDTPSIFKDDFLRGQSIHVHINSTVK